MGFFTYLHVFQSRMRQRRFFNSQFTFARALVNLAYAGFHSWMIVFLDFRIRENDGRCSAAQ